MHSKNSARKWLPMPVTAVGKTTKFLKKSVTAYVKYNYFHKEPKRTLKNNSFLDQNLFYNAEMDFFVCPMEQGMENIGTGMRVSGNGYESQVTYYQAKRCEGCRL